MRTGEWTESIGNKAQTQVFVKVLVGSDIAAAALQAHFHVQLAAFRNRGDVDVLVQNFHVAISLDHAGGDHARLLGVQVDGFRTVAVQLERNLLQVQDNVSCVFYNAGDRLEFVQHAFNLYGGYGSAFNGRQQHAPQRVADGGAEAALKRLGVKPAVFIGERLGINCETLGFLETSPENHIFCPFNSAPFGACGLGGHKAVLVRAIAKP